MPGELKQSTLETFGKTQRVLEYREYVSSEAMAGTDGYAALVVVEHGLKVILAQAKTQLLTPEWRTLRISTEDDEPYGISTGVVVRIRLICKET